MKRNPDLVKAILVAVEANTNPGHWVDIELPDTSAIDIAYHIKIMCEGGLLEGDDLTVRSGFDWKATDLTWQGYEFLDTIKNDTVWAKTKDFVKSKGGSTSLTVIGKIAAAFAANHHLLDKL
jgi:hypothetical protein